jgi:hypothetical protein
VVAVPRLAIPFTLTAAEFSLSALQASQQCRNFRSAHIFHQISSQRIFFFFVAEPKGYCTFLSCELHMPVGKKETYFHYEVTLPSN